MLPKDEFKDYEYVVNDIKAFFMWEFEGLDERHYTERHDEEYREYKESYHFRELSKSCELFSILLFH